MKVCYIVYREDNVMVFNSQVLEYLKNLKKFKACTEVENIELILFRHGNNARKKRALEDRVIGYTDSCKTFFSLPVLSFIQLSLNAQRLKAYVNKMYSSDDKIAVICRGDISAYIAEKAFAGHKNSRILYDNRGLAIEESVAAHKNSIIHRLNRRQKRKAMLCAKDHCDMYNFVTEAMRNYDIEKYSYDKNLPYTIIPTLYNIEPLKEERIDEIKVTEGISENNIIVSYIGSTAAWQSTELLKDVIVKIGKRYPSAKVFVLTDGKLSWIDCLNEEIRKRVAVKNIPHSEIRYYLNLTDVGIIIRDDNIINRVAAPTKIAEYLMNDASVLKSGNIGILNDIKKLDKNIAVTAIDENDRWLSAVKKKSGKCAETVKEYFDMSERQKETLEMIRKSFRMPKRL